MKTIFNLLLILVVTGSFKPENKIAASAQCYDPEYVLTSNVPYKNEMYSVIYMKRDGDRVKVKYFAASDYNGNNVFQRYTEWSAGKNIILVSSGTYMDSYGTPVGLTIDNGIPVNKSLTNDFDGLVIVYATGGIVVSNLKDGDLILKGGGIDEKKKFDLRNSPWDLQAFIDWSANREATVFQTHLLVYKNNLIISSFNSSTKSAERRFLAAGTDEDGKVVHVIVQSPSHCTLYEGAQRTLEFLQQMKDMNVTFMINLDTGYQDVFEMHNKDCTINTDIRGQKPISTAVNLLSYYFQ